MLQTFPPYRELIPKLQHSSRIRRRVVEVEELRQDRIQRAMRLKGPYVGRKPEGSHRILRSCRYLSGTGGSMTPSSLSARRWLSGSVAAWSGGAGGQAGLSDTRHSAPPPRPAHAPRGHSAPAHSAPTARITASACYVSNE